MWLVFFLCFCLSFSYILACLLLTFSLIFFLCSCLFSSYVLAHFLLTFSLIFFLHSHRLIVNICHRLYILLNQISRHVIKQSEEVFLKVIFRFLLADSFSVKLICITVFLTKVTCHQAIWKCFSESHFQIFSSKFFLDRIDVYINLLCRSVMYVNFHYRTDVISNLHHRLQMHFDTCLHRSCE